MENRTSLQIINGRLILTTLVDCEKLRIRRKIMNFVLDTGSPSSYISYKDALKLHIPLDKQSTGITNFGGSKFNIILMPKFKFYLIKSGDGQIAELQNVQISVLKPTKTSKEHKIAFEALPSILGLDFLREQKLSLHVILTEEMAYLKYED